MLDAERPLAPGAVKHVPGEPGLDAEDILHLLILLQSETVLQHENQTVQVQGLAGNGQLDAVAPVKTGSFHRQAVIVSLRPGQGQRAAPFLVTGVAAQQCPWHQSAAGAAFDGGHAAGRPYAAAGTGMGQGRNAHE